MVPEIRKPRAQPVVKEDKNHALDSTSPNCAPKVASIGDVVGTGQNEMPTEDERRDIEIQVFHVMDERLASAGWSVASLLSTCWRCSVGRMSVLETPTFSMSLGESMVSILG